MPGRAGRALFNAFLAAMLAVSMTPSAALADAASGSPAATEGIAGATVSAGTETDADNAPRAEEPTTAVAAGDTAVDASATDCSSPSSEGDLLVAEENALDYVGVDTAADAASLAYTDGEAASGNVQALAALFYAAFDAGETTLDLTDYTYTVAELREARGMAVVNAEYYYVTPYTSFSYYDSDGDQAADDDERAAYAYIAYVVDASELATAKAAVEEKIATALSWVDADGMTQFQAVQALHDYLVRTCAYDTQLESDYSSATTSAQRASLAKDAAFTAYGALAEGSCVCQGYALAYKLLLGRLGLGCVAVRSESMNHMWNMVRMDDGEWYHVDVTWDDPVCTASDGTHYDDGFDADVSHAYFLRSDSSMTSLSHHGWSAAYATPESDYANRAYATYDGPAASATSATGDDGKDRAAAYKNSSTATQNGVTFTVQWNDPVAGSDATFHVTQAGGSSGARARMDVPTYIDPDGSSESVCDPSDPYGKNGWGDYHALGDEGCDFTFSFTASGQYRMIFYFMDTTNGVTYLRTTFTIDIDDSAHPAVSAIVEGAVAQARRETDGGEYAMALWLHDWELAQLDYDYSYNYCSAESGLTRGKGTCESFQRIYQKLLTCAGIENARMEGNGHTWNAVKIDGEWCQADVNWDDTDYSSSYGFDSTHLYFGLSDELMAKAHSDHAATYQADGYACRSTGLSNNYFVRSGKAAEWAQAYAERIQEHLDAKEASFSIASDNASLPPSIGGIQNAIVAYAMNQMDWAANGAAVEIAATSNVTTQSSTSWTATYDFTAEYGSAQTQAVYRMYNPITSEHLFTTNEAEYTSLVDHDWVQEGVAWSSPKSGAKGVYRLYNPALGAMGRMSHHYTTDYAEAVNLVENHGWVWDYDGEPIFYSAEGDSGALDGAEPVYRLYNGGLSAHHYTLDADENSSLIKHHDWTGEGVGFYAYLAS